MQKWLKGTVYVLSAAAVVLLAAKALPVNNEDHDRDEAVSEVAITVESEVIENPEYEYVLKEFNGKLAVFQWGEREPAMIFDVPIDSLPEIDANQLKQGLKIKDDQELNDRIEDFVS